MTHAQAINTRPALYAGEKTEFTHNGKTYIVQIEADTDHGAPWEENDGHGHVTDWETRDKRPGEVVLTHDRYTKRFYDVAETMRTARRDAWGLSPDAMARFLERREFAWRNRANRRRLETVGYLVGPMPKPTRGEILAEAVRLDFEFLQGWCLDRWHYVGVCVYQAGDENPDPYRHAVWGIESEDVAYLWETAEALADEIEAEAAKAAEAEAEARKNWGRFVVCTESSTGKRLNVTTYASNADTARAMVEKCYCLPPSVIKAIYQVNGAGFLLHATGDKAGELYRVTPPAWEIKQTDAPRNPYRTGYGEAVPTGYKIKGSRGQWLRVYCRIFSNAGTLWARHPSGYRVAVDMENA